MINFLIGVVFGVSTCGAFVAWIFASPKRSADFIRGMCESARPEFRKVVDQKISEMSREAIDEIIQARQEELEENA